VDQQTRISPPDLLPVRGGGRALGTFPLSPTPVTPISQEQCLVAVALVDQLGATVAHQVN
jgi:hypothetical protein